MRVFSSFLALVTVLLPPSTLSLPLQKRIDQTTIDSVQPWENACNAAGGKDQCNKIAVNAAATLLAAAGPCDQQNNADIMVSLAKQLNNDADMIQFAQIFAQQPRNSPTSQAVPYCQSAPNNTELNGLFQCQFAGANEATFVGGIAVGGAGTIPFGQTTPLSPPGSCPANPSGPVPDGVQLVSITQDPGLSNVGSSGASSNSSASATASAVASSAVPSTNTTTSAVASSTSAAASATTTATATDDGDDGSCSTAEPVTITSIITVSAASTATDSSAATATDASATTATDSSVTTSTAAATTATASAVSASVTNSVLTNSVPSSTVSSPAASASASSASNSTSLVAQNALAAQQLNAQFKTLTASSPCSLGDADACIGGGLAQCAPAAAGGGAWTVTPCPGGTTCVALPLLFANGTTISCDTSGDAVARFAQAGVTGGIDGSS